MPETPEIRYQHNLTYNGYTSDMAQAEAVKQLQVLYDQLIHPRQKRFLPISWLGIKTAPPIQGLYLWGGVGRGKTWLMDMFYDCLPFDNKLRMHFHHFMKYVHKQLREQAGQKNPLTLVAKELANRTTVLCFDEFFVSDITDAMILAGLLGELFKQGVTLVTTSNVVPDELYKDGLQRSRFLPAIALLKEHTTVLNVDGGTDYRLRILEQATTYHYPIDQQSHQKLKQTFSKLASTPNTNGVKSMTIDGRSINCIAKTEGILWVTFSELCDGPRNQNDYIEIAYLFHTIIMEGLPLLTEDMDDQARRFISLIDELYDRSVTLVISAETGITEIYQGTRLAFEFQRTISRLQEMQSIQYISRSHLEN